MSNSDAGIGNTPYSGKELKHFEALLKEEKKESLEEKERLQESLEDLEKTDDDKSSSQAHHSGNIGSEEEEKETFFTLLQKEEEKISKINDALDRIEQKTYGVCQATGKKIKKERLEAIPYTKYSIEAKEKNESLS